MQRYFFHDYLGWITIGLHNQLFPKHPTTMISQRAVILSALVALFALLSAADAQQLRANNKRVLIEQEVSSFKSNPNAPIGSFRAVRRTHHVLKVPLHVP